MEYTVLKPSLAEGILLVTISRPAALNALNTLFFREFNELLNEYEGNKEVKVMIITGEGKAFVAGADIAEMVNMGPEEASGFSRTGQLLFDRIEQLPFPVIGAINGFALGGGCELAMACDFRIAGKNAKFGQPEMSLGLIPGYAATQRLSRLCGMGNALFLLMTGETITADDALRIGLVQKVTEQETLMEEVLKIAKKIASNGSKAIEKVKEVTRKGRTMDFNDACLLEADEFGKRFGEAPSKEGMRAFLEKRKPEW
jgi:enoyl-CoA hydratase